MTPVDFDGESVIVTGAGRGLGREYALELARRGARIVVNDVVEDAASEVAAEVEEIGADALVSVASVSDPDGARSLVATALRGFGAVHALVNNAGIMRNGMLEDLEPRDLEEVLEVNLAGHFYPCQAVWGAMREAGYGRIVMTSSGAGMFAMQGESNYAASKGGVYGLMKALAEEGRPDGIAVNAVLPMANTAMGANDPVPGHAGRYPAWANAALRPRRKAEAVSPMVALLAHRAWAHTGEAYSAGFGRYGRVFLAETPGWVGPTDSPATAEQILEHAGRIRDTEGFAIPANIYEEIEFIARSMGVDAPRDGSSPD
jgi:NAD(P)-dependent dehydrogenase (short-subunit alcohol dehydrogenase family)